MNWIPEVRSPRGGATGEAFVNTLDSTLGPEGLLSRESIQNTVDARTRNKPKVLFREVILHGKRKSDFVHDFALDGTFPEPRHTPRGMRPAIQDLSDGSKPLRLIYVEDFGAHGLYGDPFRAASPFSRMLFSLGDGSKVRTDSGTGGSGGSYGYGKAAYFRLSRFHTIAAYTVFNPENDKDLHQSRRLIGCAFLPPFSDEDKDFTGRAWLGAPDTRPKHRGEVGPFTESDAENLAKRLGFTPRSANDTGTSILIVDATLDLKNLQAEVENWWWPRLVAGELEVDIVDHSGDHFIPRPTKRVDLEPFIRCFEMARTRATPDPKRDKSMETKSKDGFNRGRWALTTIDDTTVKDQRVNSRSMALIRRPLMVVKYFQETSHRVSPMNWAGVFLASEQADRPLMLSEPPTHDNWSQDSRRLMEESDEYPVDFVDDLFRALRKQITLFTRAATPDTPTDLRMNELERMLGSLIKQTKGGPPLPPKGLPIHVGFHELQTQASGPDLVATGEFEIGLLPRSKQEEYLLTVSVSTSLASEDGLIADLAPRTQLGTATGELQDSVTVLVTKRVSVRLMFRTEPYDRDWTVEPRVVVSELRASDATSS